MKITRDRVEDFRKTMVEIIDIKNGRKQPDEDDCAGPQSSIDQDERADKAGTAEGFIIKRRRKMVS